MLDLISYLVKRTRVILLKIYSAEFTEGQVNGKR